MDMNNSLVKVKRGWGGEDGGGQMGSAVIMSKLKILIKV